MATSGDWSYSDKGLDQREQPGRSQPKANEAARHSFHNRRALRRSTDCDAILVPSNIISACCRVPPYLTRLGRRY